MVGVSRLSPEEEKERARLRMTLNRAVSQLENSATAGDTVQLRTNVNVGRP
jgi:hypothetical protein